MIYILEDDASIRKLVVYTIQSQGMEAEGFERPSQFWEALEQKTPELVLLDIMLPVMDGWSVLKKIRESSKVPVDYTPVKYVKKPGGARPGMVIYTTYETAWVTPDGELAKRLRVR